MNLTNKLKCLIHGHRMKFIQNLAGPEYGYYHFQEFSCSRCGHKHIKEIVQIPGKEMITR